MELIKSPLNYTGGKFKLLGQLLPLFPPTEDCDTFIDLFCGGCNVAANVEYSKVIANDSLGQLIGIYEHFKALSPQDIDGLIEQHIAEYNLSKTNKEGYYKLKDKYNSTKDNSLLFTLICYAFNNQIRFNKSGEYNMPFGKDRSSYNKAIKERIPSFVSRVKNIEFRNESFEKIEPEGNSFIYCDPPYLITTATYNESGGWTEKEEVKLLDYLDRCNSQGVKFALSNVLTHKGKVNSILDNWAEKYNIHYLNKNYDSCSYHTKIEVGQKTTEILVTNY